MASLLCTTRFDHRLEALEWNNAPDGSPSSYLLLAHQLDRVLTCRWPVYDTLDYAALKNVCDDAVRDVGGPLKVRVVFPPSGAITASITPVEPLRFDPTEASRFNPDMHDHTLFDPILSIGIDTQPTSGTTLMKTTNRQPYEDARARVGISPRLDLTSNHPDDVILFNPAGEIMESSIFNVAFYRHGSWLTPPLTVSCISGVFRRWLLENGRIHEAEKGTLLVDTLLNDEWVLLFNGVMGCRLGRVRRDGGSGLQ